MADQTTAQRRLLTRLDRALLRQGIVSPHEQRRREREKEARARQSERRLLARDRAAAAQHSKRELWAAIQAEGGIRPNRDYPSREIPSALRARSGRGLAPDEMAGALAMHGMHYDGDVAMFRDIQRRQENAERASADTRGDRRPRGVEVICYLFYRRPSGRFAPKGEGRPDPPPDCRPVKRTALGEFK